MEVYVCLYGVFTVAFPLARRSGAAFVRGQCSLLRTVRWLEYNALTKHHGDFRGT